METKMKNIIALSVILALALIGCATQNTTPEPTICNDLTNSWICNKIHEKGWDPAKVRDYIIDVDLAALAIAGRYSKQDALTYTQSVREILETGCSYRYLIKWLGENSQQWSGDKQGYAVAGIILISRHINTFDSTLIISVDDRAVILRMLDKIDEAVNQYY
jgi:hypothetical protein